MAATSGLESRQTAAGWFLVLEREMSAPAPEAAGPVAFVPGPADARNHRRTAWVLWDARVSFVLPHLFCEPSAIAPAHDFGTTSSRAATDGG